MPTGATSWSRRSRRGGIQVLDRDWTICAAGGVDVGVVGVKGFVGGFPGSHLPDFGEPLLRRVYHETSLEVEALDRGLREIALCPARIVLLHYAPIEATIEGEAPGIWAFLGTDRLAAPIAEHEPDLVLHGHAHSGTFSGQPSATSPSTTSRSRSSAVTSGSSSSTSGRRRGRRSTERPHPAWASSCEAGHGTAPVFGTTPGSSPALAVHLSNRSS